METDTSWLGDVPFVTFGNRVTRIIDGVLVISAKLPLDVTVGITTERASSAVVGLFVFRVLFTEPESISVMGLSWRVAMGRESSFVGDGYTLGSVASFRVANATLSAMFSMECWLWLDWDDGAGIKLNRFSLSFDTSGVGIRGRFFCGAVESAPFKLNLESIRGETEKCRSKMLDFHCRSLTLLQ